MDERRIIELFHNKEFVEKFKNINNKRDAITLFKHNGVDINDDEYLKEICEKYVDSNGKVDDEDLSDVVAGTDYMKISMDVGEKLGALGAVTYDYCKSFADSCRKGYNDMTLKLKRNENNKK